MTRHDGHRVSQATVLRLLRDEGLILEANYQRERRKLAERRKAAFAKEPTGPNQVWQLDFSEYETTVGGTWRIGSCRDYWAEYEFDAHVSPTANKHDAVAAVELALAEAEALIGRPLIDDCEVDEATGELVPVLTIVTDNGGPFRSFTFEAFIATRPEIRHVRTRVRTPGQNGSRERGFGTMKYEWLFREEIDDGLQLVDQINAYRHDYNHVRPHEAIAWNRPAEVYADQTTPPPPSPTSKSKKSCQLLDAGHESPLAHPQRTSGSAVSSSARGLSSDPGGCRSRVATVDTTSGAARVLQ